MRCDKKLYLSLSRSRFFSPLSGLWDVQSPNGRISVAAQARESNVGASSSRKQQGKQLEKYSLRCSTGNLDLEEYNMRISVISSWCKRLFCREICRM
jgi:hypothetical protein